MFLHTQYTCQQLKNLRDIRGNLGDNPKRMCLCLHQLFKLQKQLQDISLDRISICMYHPNKSLNRLHNYSQHYRIMHNFHNKFKDCMNLHNHLALQESTLVYKECIQNQDWQNQEFSMLMKLWDNSLFNKKQVYRHLLLASHNRSQNIQYIVMSFHSKQINYNQLKLLQRFLQIFVK